jgi:AraC family cel operon transcriptional repressor
VHTQDFHELVVVTSGDIRHKVAGVVQDLRSGDLVFVRPQDRHALKAESIQATVLLAAINPELITSIIARYPALMGHLFWSDQVLPDHIPAVLAKEIDVEALVDRLISSSCDRLATEAFLLPLCAGLLDRFPRDLPPLQPGAPDWLVAACATIRSPTIFRGGAASFVREARRTHAHVCRTLQRYLGMNPAAFVNHHRMSHAARLLERTDGKISEIARDCGIPNMSHFHSIFHKHHGMTPSKYRKAHHRDLIKPHRDQPRAPLFKDTPSETSSV